MKRLAVITALILCVCLMPAYAGERKDQMLAVKIVNVNPAKMADYEKAHKKALGDTVKPLHEKFLSMTREVETVRGWFRPDLSYMPDEEPAAEQKAD